MGRHKGIRNRLTFRMSQRVTYKGKRAIVINNTSLSLLGKIKISIQSENEQPFGSDERLEVFENDPDLVKGWKR
jgi:hypothetical protein